MSADDAAAGPVPDRLMRVHAAPAGDAPVTEGAGASPYPLLSGALQDRALRLAGALAETIRPMVMADHGNGSLASGSAGLAVCSGQIAWTRSDRRAAQAARAYLEEAVDVLATEPLTSSLYSGFTGIAWAAELVDRLLGTEGEDRNGDIDEALSRLLRQYPEPAAYDLVNGLTGIGVYALARWPRPGAMPCILGVIEQLARRARYDHDGVYWWTGPSWKGPRRDRYWPGGVDLGVAHGIAGVVPFLARVHRLGLAQQTVRPLLDGAVGWLLAHMVDTAAGPTVPSFVADGVDPGPARSAWCYGDPGVAAALLVAARDADEPGWVATATDLAVRAAARPPDETGAVDAGLCHGSAGLAHLFHRMYQMTAEPALAEAARFWVERTLELCSAAAPIDAASSAWNGPGLLEGAAGVALAMEAAGTTAEPAWDQMLLVSTAGPAGAPAP
jgi:lantibiotic modifying enzyme